MAGEHQKSLHVNIEIEPTGISPEAQEHPDYWFTLGDLHGNALKLLHFLKIQGAAEMGQPGDYARFAEIYKKDVNDLTYDDLEDLHNIITRLKINPQAHIRLLGDDLGDRGSNDYFTLMLLEKLIDETEKEGSVEILISNHSDSFIECIENNRGFDENGLAADPRYKAQAHSSLCLQKLIDHDFATREKVLRVYDKYSTKLKAFSYERNAAGEISSIYSHAPMGEEDIYKMGLGLAKYSHDARFKNLFSDAHRRQLTQLIKKIRRSNHSHGISSQLLAELMDLINDITQYNIAQSTLNKLIYIGPDITDRDMLNGYGLDALIHPFYTLIWNRDPRDDQALNDRRILPIDYINGHDLARKNPNPKRKSHDSLLGKGPEYPEGLMEFSCTDSMTYEAPALTENEEDLEDDSSETQSENYSAAPAMATAMVGATLFAKPISLIPYTHGIVLNVAILPYFAGKLAYWLQYAISSWNADKYTDQKLIEQDAQNTETHLCLGLAGMAASTYLGDFGIYILKQLNLNISGHFFEETLSYTSNIIHHCPIELKGALMIVAGIGFAVGTTMAKYQQTHEQLNGFALFAELAITFCFGFLIGVVASIGYGQSTAAALLPAVTAAPLFLGAKHQWMKPQITPDPIPEAQTNDDPQFANLGLLAHIQT